MSAHFTGEQRPGLGHLLLYQRVPGAPDERLAAKRRHLVEQHIARLDVCDDGSPGRRRQDIAGQDREQLIAPQDARFAIDHAEAIAVAVKGETEVAAVLVNRRLKIDKVVGHRWIGVMGRKASVDGLVKKNVPSRKALAQRRENLTRRAIAGIPSGRDTGWRLHIARQSSHIIVKRRPFANRPRAVGVVACLGALAEGEQIGPEEWPPSEHQFEAVVVLRIVRSRHHDAAAGAVLEDREVEHRGRPTADAQHRQAAGAQPIG